jgi:hypothetical protein
MLEEEIRAHSLLWKKWGPYLSDRQWGTVREDYSPDGAAWEYFPHDHARSRAYRWGEDGIAGISDDKQLACFSVALWNHKDPILKERFFGLTGNEGNHGEDVKEYYYYLDSTPSHSYMKMLYRYPIEAYPYQDIINHNIHRDKHVEEFDLIDTGIFDNNNFFDVFIEYAKVTEEDILIKISIKNCSNKIAPITVIPQFWFRNNWSWHPNNNKPKMFGVAADSVYMEHDLLGKRYAYSKKEVDRWFCDNETNFNKLFKTQNQSKYTKDAFHEYLINNNQNAINPDDMGTKAGFVHKYSIEANTTEVLYLRWTNEFIEEPFNDFDFFFNKRREEANEFYNNIQKHVFNDELKKIQRQAYAGMMWSKQYYAFNIYEWMYGDPEFPKPPESRINSRNKHWKHFDSEVILSMPDKWEYPWFAAWDLAFHVIPLARIDMPFAKQQLEVLLNEKHLHPNGQIPAYEWNFSDVNPPVHAWAALRIFQIDKKQHNGKADFDFLERIFHKLLLNFTWWVNQKDTEGNNIFEGGFLGLDNIGLFDRSQATPSGGHLEQADGTAWMAMYSLNMLRIALELSLNNPNYQSMASKFFIHFHHIASALDNLGEDSFSLWDDEDQFFYDVLHLPNNESHRLKIRSMVGLIPLFAVETLKPEAFEHLPEFKKELENIMKNKPDLVELVSRWNEQGKGNRRLLSLLRGFRMNKVLEKVFNENEFLSPYGVRSLSKFHDKNPYHFYLDHAVYSINYQPGNSNTTVFGGNSNWRGPIWFPMNYLIIESLFKYDIFYGDEYKIEAPVGSNNYITLREAGVLIAERLIQLFLKNNKGIRNIYNDQKNMANTTSFNEEILFYEFFNGDTGSGLGANHQTGWTGLIADMIHKYCEYKNRDNLPYNL